MIDHPDSRHIPGLRQLWTRVFGDPESYLDLYFREAFSPDRCLCALEGETVTGMVHWLPCTMEGRKYAYLYALAVAPEHRGQGLARRLLNAAHHLLTLENWAGVLLVPEKEALEDLYRKFGYETACHYAEGICGAVADSVSLHRITGEAYALARKELLGPGGLEQAAPFLQMMPQVKYYRGTDFLLAAREETDHLFGLELLGNTAVAPRILSALGQAWGRFRSPGQRRKGAMYKPLSPDAPTPRYFAFDLS